MQLLAAAALCSSSTSMFLVVAFVTRSFVTGRRTRCMHIWLLGAVSSPQVPIRHSLQIPDFDPWALRTLPLSYAPLRPACSLLVCSSSQSFITLSRNKGLVRSQTCTFSSPQHKDLSMGISAVARMSACIAVISTCNAQLDPDYRREDFTSGECGGSA